MKRLGNTNLFTSDFVMGSCESELKFTKTHTIEIEVLHKWMDYKDSDWGMKKYQTKRTQYISFPHLIDLQDLSLIIQDLMHIYKLQYPYGTKEDFIETVFRYTIFDIKNFIESEYTWYGGCPNIMEFDFYYTYERIGSELIDFILDADKDIDYYKQYFKKVLQLIEDIEYNPIALVPLAYEQPETKTEQETPTFTNNFDKVKPTELYNHFKAGLVEKGYLTEEELKQYLKAAFVLKTIPERLFKLKHTPTKQKIYTVFYVYYKDVSDKKHERQREYAALLGEYFEGYDTKIIQTNWARDYKTKR